MGTWGYRGGDGALYTYTYDAFGRLMQVQTNFVGHHTKYRYNGLGFRIMWQHDADLSFTTLTDSERYYFMYDERWRIVGTFRNTDDYAKESFVYHAAGKAGRGDASYIDSVILRDRDTTNGWTGNPDGSLEERRFYCQNWRADVVAITNSSGLPYEFVRYTSYGKAQVFAAADVNRDGIVNATDADDWDDLYSENPSGAAIPVDFNFDGSSFDPTDTDDFNALYSAQSGFSSAGQLSSLGNRKGYAGYEFDQPVEAYHVRHRVYLPEVGRWTRRDPLGYVDGMGLYQYVQSMAVTKIDPTGWQPPAKKEDPCKELKEKEVEKYKAYQRAQERAHDCNVNPPPAGPIDPRHPEDPPRPAGCDALNRARDKAYDDWQKALDERIACEERRDNPPNNTPGPPVNDPPVSPPTSTPPSATPIDNQFSCTDQLDDYVAPNPDSPTCDAVYNTNLAICQECCSQVPGIPAWAGCIADCGLTATGLKNSCRRGRGVQ